MERYNMVPNIVMGLDCDKPKVTWLDFLFLFLFLFLFFFLFLPPKIRIISHIPGSVQQAIGQNQWTIAELELFGSVSQGFDSNASDINVKFKSLSLSTNIGVKIIKSVTPRLGY